MLVDVMQELVVENVKFILKYDETGFCDCDKCFEDVCAIVLNSLPSLYRRISDTKEIDTVKKANSRQVAMDIKVHIAKAVEIVRNSPRH